MIIIINVTTFTKTNRFILPTYKYLSPLPSFCFVFSPHVGGYLVDGSDDNGSDRFRICQKLWETVQMNTEVYNVISSSAFANA